jgi:hypothetical protein
VAAKNATTTIPIVCGGIEPFSCATPGLLREGVMP